MNMKKVLSMTAAAAMAISMMSIAADATNWSTASYADDDPSTVTIVSTSEDKVTFTQTADGTTAKCRITAADILAEEDLAKVKSASWTITYDGFTTETEAGNGVGGGTYFGCKNSTGYWISPDYDDDGNSYWANASYSVEDSVKFLLPTDTLTTESELVFMDWSNGNLVSNNVTVSISNLKFFDADGNEIAQKAYEGAAAAEDTAVETTEAAPAADATTTSTATGNTAAAAIASVMAVAGVAAIAAKKRK